MKLHVLGVGEAFSSHYPNNSHLVISESKLLLDCGSTVPQKVWQFNNDPAFLDAVFISHPHADHYFGLPQLILKMWRDGRTKPFTIICAEGLKENIIQVLRLGYRSIMEKVENKFRLEFLEVNTKETFSFNELELRFALTNHSRENLAIRVSDKEKVLCYSGDGDFTDQSKELYRDANLLIHETFLFREKIEGHATVEEVASMASQQGVKILALTHIKEGFRQELEKGFEEKTADLSTGDTKVILPSPGDTIDL